jgi:hypothetical protein
MVGRPKSEVAGGAEPGFAFSVEHEVLDVS